MKDIGRMLAINSLGEFLKGYAGNKSCGGLGLASYIRNGDSRGLAQACDQEKCFRSVGLGC